MTIPSRTSSKDCLITTNYFSDAFEQRKAQVQRRLYNDFGIKVDQVLQGHGTTNTGNLARKCFAEPKKFANSLEINEEFVERIATIILLFKCKKTLNLDDVEIFCLDTYEMHYVLFPWTRINPSLHKLLMHGCQIARKFPVPMIYFSEDASEAWHKLYRKNILEHSRQISRSARLLDTFNRAVYLSDPLISLIFIQKRLKYHKTLKIPLHAKKFIHQTYVCFTILCIRIYKQCTIIELTFL